MCVCVCVCVCKFPFYKCPPFVFMAPPLCRRSLEQYTFSGTVRSKSHQRTVTNCTEQKGCVCPSLTVNKEPLPTVGPQQQVISLCPPFSFRIIVCHFFPPLCLLRLCSASILLLWFVLQGSYRNEPENFAKNAAIKGSLFYVWN